jgi:predicted small integral membrane protein
MDTIVPLPFQHKSNFFHFFKLLKKLFIICVKILIKSKVQLLGFELQIFHNNDLRLKQFKHTRLFHKIGSTLFIILYNHYLSKNSKLKNQVPKLRFQI